MKISKYIIAILFVGVCCFVMNIMGCGGGSGFTDTALEGDGETAPTLETMLEMPQVSVVTTTVDDSAGTCLLSFVPDNMNFLGSLLMQEARELIYLLGFGNLENQEIKDTVDQFVAMVREIVVFVDDEGTYVVLARLVEGQDMNEFVDGKLADLIADLNDSLKEEETRVYSYLIIDGNTVAMSLSADLMIAAAERLANGNVTSECSFYRISKGQPISARPVLYALAKGTTTLLDSYLEEGPLAEHEDAIRNTVALVGADMLNGVVRLYVGTLDISIPEAYEVTSSFSFHINTNNAFIGLLIDQLSGSLLNFEDNGEEEEEEEEEQQGPQVG